MATARTAPRIGECLVAAVSAALQDAPAFDWVNSSTPLRLADLTGRVVVLLFWNGEDMHCANVLPSLQRSLQRFHDGLVLLGVHVPRHAAQRQSAMVARAAQRLHLRFPVANDADWLHWRHYGIEAWPSAVVLDCSGRIMRVLEGEALTADLDALIERLLEDAAARDLRRFDAAPRTNSGEIQTHLRFPSGIAVGEQRLYIADSSRNRVLECTLQGRVLRQFGSGTPGYWDGHVSDAGLCDPQQLLLAGEMLYVADTGNHAVRRIRLASGQIETVLGCGRAGYALPTAGTGATQLAINAPVGLALRDNQLYVALAGQQQIWKLDLGATGSVQVLAGSGRQGADDGAADVATFMQPGALALQGGLLLIADAGANALRALRLADAQVLTLCGGGPWQAGRTDAAGRAARFAHPLALVAEPGNGAVYLADTLNGRVVRCVGSEGWQAQTLASAANLVEPAALALHGRTLWIGERGAHVIVRVDLDSGQSARIGED